MSAALSAAEGRQAELEAENRALAKKVRNLALFCVFGMILPRVLHSVDAMNGFTVVLLLEDGGAGRVNP